jgi:hypothetical protein
MRRSGALTLGVVLTLGAVTGGRGQELSSSVTAGNGSLFDGFVLPSVPENWSDLPFKLTASQTVSYNSNLNGVPIGFGRPGTLLGDFTTSSNVGFSTRANVYGQQVFVDLTYGIVRYLHQISSNSNVYSLNAGVDWNITSRCSGALSVSLSKSPAELTELIGTGVNYSTSTALNETGKCAVSNGYSFVFNSGLTSVTNSNPIDSINDSQTKLISAGIEYAKGYSTLTLLASNAETDYNGRSAAAAVTGLLNSTDFHSFTLNYTRTINANLSVTGLIGVVGTTNGFTLGLPKSLLPIYTLSTTWAFSPKWSLNASAARTIAPPTTVIANAQTTYNAFVGLGYQMTPKVALNASGAISYSTSAFTPAVTEAIFTPFLVGTQKSYTLSAGMTYSMTPFLTAALNASYTERVGNGFITPQDLVTVSLNYRPY